MPTLTSHYGFTKPTIKGDNYAWDIELNSALDAIDSEIWAATGGVNTGVNIQTSNVNITLSNPMVGTQNITMTAANMSAILPAMNSVNSPQVGSKLSFINSGSISYNVVSNDGVTVVAAVPAGTTLVMTVNSNSTSNGSFTLQNSLQSANNLADVANTANALNNILPSQSSNSGKALVSNGTSPAWQTIITPITGEIKMWPTNTAPSGYLECNGAAVSRTTYSALFAVISTVWGAGDGSTTFNIPDFRGQFPRGWDHGAGVDAGRTLGTQQVDTYANHNHTTSVSDPSHTHTAQSIQTVRAGNTGNYWDVVMRDTGASAGGAATNPGYQSANPLIANVTGIGVTVNNSTTGGTETRPKNVAVMFIIKT